MKAPHEGFHFHVYTHKMILLYCWSIARLSGWSGSGSGRGSQCGPHIWATMVCFTDEPSDPDEKSTFAFVYMDCVSVWTSRMASENLTTQIEGAFVHTVGIYVLKVGMVTAWYNLINGLVFATFCLR